MVKGKSGSPCASMACPSTFSVVGSDPAKGELGVATQSKFIAVGAVVPWAKAKVGAIATQSLANTTFGPRGLDLLAKGLSVDAVLEQLLSEDLEREQRQVGIVDFEGRAAAYTGKECYEWAGHIVGRGYCALGNILVSEETIKAMSEAFESTHGDLVDRLLASLEAGEKAGGDKRGRQSAALLVVKEGGGYGGFSDRYIDVRVDDHPDPISELKRVFAIYDATLLNREDPLDVVKIAGENAKRIQRALKILGFYRGKITGKYDDETKRAMEDYFGINNFENKMRRDEYIWGTIYRHMMREAGTAGSKPRRTRDHRFM